MRHAAFKQLDEIGEEELNEAVMDLVIGLRNEFDEKEAEMGKVRERRVVTPESLMEVGREIRRLVIATSKVEDRLAGLAPEERLAGLAPEERLAGLTPEQMAELVERIDAYLRQVQAQPESS